MSANDFIDDIPSGCLFADPATLPGDYKPAKEYFCGKLQNMQKESKKKKEETLHRKNYNSLS